MGPPEPALAFSGDGDGGAPRLPAVWPGSVRGFYL
jgi:hypothetical protein